MKTCGKVLEMVDGEIEAKLGQPWKDLKTINDSFVAIHTILVLWRLVIDPLFPTYTKVEQNILKWGALLHDIRKLGYPVYEGKDHIHPFKSAQSVIQIFVNLGMLKPTRKQQESLRQVQRLIDESVQPLWQEERRHFKHG